MKIFSTFLAFLSFPPFLATILVRAETDFPRRLKAAVDGSVRSANLNMQRDMQQASCSDSKKVKITKFWINGDCDAGATGEHQLRLDGSKYFPIFSSDCDQDPDGYCSFREGQIHDIEQKAPWKNIPAFQSLTVGTEEYDSTSENDSSSNALTANDWYNPSCDPYEVVIARDFSAEVQKSLCWNVGASVAGGNGAVTGEINAGIESCSEWTEPAESFVWYLRVEPEEVYPVVPTNPPTSPPIVPPTLAPTTAMPTAAPSKSPTVEPAASTDLPSATPTISSSSKEDVSAAGAGASSSPTLVLLTLAAAVAAIMALPLL